MATRSMMFIPFVTNSHLPGADTKRRDCSSEGKTVVSPLEQKQRLLARGFSHAAPAVQGWMAI